MGWVDEKEAVTEEKWGGSERMDEVEEKSEEE